MPSQGGAFVPSLDYDFTGTVTLNGVAPVSVSGTQTLTNKTLTAPVLSGSVTGTYTLAGTPTLTSPTINAPSITEAFNTYSDDGAITIASQVAFLTKTSAGAYTVAAPGASGIGKVLKLTTGTDFAHVVTFTGGTLWDGTAGANTTWTSAAVQGSSLTVVGVTATKWNVLSFNLGTIAP